MVLSRETVGVLVDLIENKLAMMQIGSRDELREVLTLQRSLAELQGLAGFDLSDSKAMMEIPRRGRHRKLADMMEEAEELRRA